MLGVVHELAPHCLRLGKLVLLVDRRVRVAPGRSFLFKFEQITWQRKHALLTWELNLSRPQILVLRYWLIVGKLQLLAVWRVDFWAEQESVFGHI